MRTNLFSDIRLIHHGERAQAPQDVLPPPQVPVPQALQGDPVQEVSRVQAGPGSS